MRVSEYFQLSRAQPTLEFVDVNIQGDTKVFVDPRSLRLIDSGAALLKGRCGTAGFRELEALIVCWMVCLCGLADSASPT